jgi:hypothetical protein
MHITSIGIDLGKTTFHPIALGERNKILLRKKFSRTQLLAYTANLPASLIGLEACAGAHFCGRRTARTRSRGATDPSVDAERSRWRSRRVCPMQQSSHQRRQRP